MSDLLFVTGISRLAVGAKYLLASPCLQPGGAQTIAFFNASSAAHAVNAVLESCPPQPWLVWIHEDVYLPVGWDVQFAASLCQAQTLWPGMALAGVYGVCGAGADAVRAGHVLDRGEMLMEPARLPCQVDSIDELLFAVRTDSGLRLDPELGFDFYATDLVLQAQAAGIPAVVVDAYCEHWSGTPRHGVAVPSLSERISASGRVFERKWAHRLPVTTPCFHIAKVGDVQAFIDAATQAS